MSNTHVMKHPLVDHLIAKMRNKDTCPAEFREAIKKLAQLEAYEALRDIQTKQIEVETPLEKTAQNVIDEENICLVPILRAGLGMSDGISVLLPHSPTGHIGMYRDEKTHIAHEYYSRLPKNIANMEVLLLDPMLATGGSAIDAVNQLKSHGAKNIRFLCAIAAPEGVAKFEKAFPEIPLYIGALDRQLNDNCYILPGLGDAGDRIFGTID
ncbi:MAG: uracil phosphoribosyltransferase [Bacilli bacterium]|nr:uracil phosphoribosyltransferase [Bacilli bacterium]